MNAEVRRGEQSRFRTTLPAAGPRSFPASVNLTAAVVQEDPQSVEGCSHVGSCSWLQQGGSRRCERQEEEGTRGFGHGLPGHLQRCYDSRVSSVSPSANAAMVCVCVCVRVLASRAKYD